MRTFLIVLFRTTVMLLIAAGPASARDAQPGQLSEAYEKFLQAGDPEQAIALGEAALTLEAATSEWKLETSRAAFQADVRSGLGRAYVDRARGIRADNIEAAIKHFELALSLPSRPARTEEAASLHSDLAVAYWNRIRGDRADSEDRALSHFETALKTFTRESHPLQWAMTNSNLATLVLTRQRGDRAANVDRSISLWKQALEVLSQDSQPQLWAAAHNNLGNAYRMRTAGTAAQNLKNANYHFALALKVFTREAAPFQWAQVQLAIASILQRGPASDQDKAISLFQSVLEVFTRDAYPQQWAQTQFVLGNALSATGNSPDQRRKAIAAYRAALTVLTLQAAPFNHLQVTRQLANALMLAGDCNAAAPVHASSRQAFLMLFGEGVDGSSTSSLVAEAGPMFADAAYCAAERGDINGAIQLANEGRARMLAASLKLQTALWSPGQRLELDNLRAAIRNEQAEVDAAFGDAKTIALDRLAAKRQELLKLVEAVAPTGGLSSSAVALAREVTVGPSALVMPVITSKGAKILLLAGGNTEKTWTVLDFPGVTLQRISEVLAGNQHEATHGWIAAYFANYFDDEEQQKRWPQWLSAIDGIGSQLWDLFGQELTKALRNKGVRPGARLILLPSGRLGVLPLGLAQDPSSKRRLLDTYELVYAPSLDAISNSFRQIANPPNATLAAVINPTGDLPGTEKEGAIVASHFPAAASASLVRDGATVTAVLGALKGKSYWHFASHGTFAWQDVSNSALIMADGERLSIARLSEAGDLGHPRLVVLSACETGLSDIVTANPDEFIGLPGSFAGLGAAGVVGTLWPVADDATALLIAKFYELHLNNGMSPPAALRQAQLWLRDATTDELKSFTASQKLEHRHAAEFSQSLSRAGSRMGGPHQITPRKGPDPDPAAPPPGIETPYAHPYYWGGFVYTGL
jgi:CHAT domain-containing protein